MICLALPYSNRERCSHHMDDIVVMDQSIIYDISIHNGVNDLISHERTLDTTIPTRLQSQSGSYNIRGDVNCPPRLDIGYPYSMI
jgi:hypothetical protein